MNSSLSKNEILPNLSIRDRRSVKVGLPATLRVNKYRDISRGFVDRRHFEFMSGNKGKHIRDYW